MGNDRAREHNAIGNQRNRDEQSKCGAHLPTERWRGMAESNAATTLCLAYWNLTILGKRINAKAQNKSFADKCKDHYSKSEVVMTRELLRVGRAWDEATIRSRAQKLAKLLVKHWL